MNVELRVAVLAVACLATLSSGQRADAVVIDFELMGRAGIGLIPLNEVGANVPILPGDSSASGGETGGGFFYDTDTNVLNFEFSFSGLSGGLFNAGSGIHLHLATPGTDPFNETGGIVFNLNSGTDTNVTLTTPTIAIGSTAGNVAGTASFTDEQEVDLFAGRYYVNIHSDQFRGGELRANVTAVPEPSTLSVLGILGTVAAYRRHRKVKA